MRGSKLKFLLAISLLLNFSFLAAAGYQYYGQSGYWISPFGAKMKKDHFIFEELSLSPEQEAAMRAKAIPFRAEINRRRAEIALKGKELIQAMRSDNPDTAAIGSIIADISHKQEEMQRRVTFHMLLMKSLLDREQQAKFLDLIENAMTQERETGCPPMHQGR